MRRIIGGLAITANNVVDSVDDWIIHTPDLDQVMMEGLSSCDGVLLGSNTYREFLEVWPGQGDENPLAVFLNSSTKYLASNSITDPSWEETVLITGDTLAEIRDLKKSSGGDLVMPGSPMLMKSLMRHGLLDELWLSVHPLLVEKGVDLFDSLPEGGLDLELVSCRPGSSGVVFLSYLITPAD